MQSLKTKNCKGRSYPSFPVSLQTYCTKEKLIGLSGEEPSVFLQCPLSTWMIWTTRVYTRRKPSTGLKFAASSNMIGRNNYKEGENRIERSPRFKPSAPLWLDNTPYHLHHGPVLSLASYEHAQHVKVFPLLCTTNPAKLIRLPFNS